MTAPITFQWQLLILVVFIVAGTVCFCMLEFKARALSKQEKPSDTGEVEHQKTEQIAVDWTWIIKILVREVASDKNINLAM